MKIIKLLKTVQEKVTAAKQIVTKQLTEITKRIGFRICPRQKLLGEIRELLDESAKRQNAINDFHFFADLVSGLQTLLALSAEHYENEADFCTEVAVEMNNQSIPLRLSRRKARCMPEAIPPELAQADVETLQEAAAKLKEEMPALLMEEDWEGLGDGLIPLLGSIIADAQAENAVLCRRGIKELITLLFEYRVEAHWFSEECIQESQKLKDNFLQTEDAASPMLYWTGIEPWRPLTSFGYYSEKEQT